MHVLLPTRLLLITALFMLPNWLSAQQDGKVEKSPEAKARAKAEQLTKDLDLSAEQQAQVLALKEVYYRKLAEIKASGDDKTTRKARTKKVKDTHEAALKRILSPAQVKRMNALEAERKAAKKEEKAKEKAQSAPAAKP